MKKLILACLTVAVLATSASAQEKETKKGWSLSALPAVSYSSDLGFQYGAFGHVYNFGDGTLYPQFKQDIGWEVSHFTKGRTRLHLSLDTKYLIPGIRFMASTTYINDPLFSFYGFNGAAQAYYQDIYSQKDYTSVMVDDPKMIPMYSAMGVDPSKKEIGYNFMRRDLFRALVDFQGDIAPNLKWAAGVAFWDFMIGDLNEEKYGYDVNSTLYNHYIKWGLIHEGEKNGGIRLEAKGGVTYDTRDLEAAPNKGIWAEAYINAAPDIFGDGEGFYAKANLHFRHFITLPITWKGGGAIFAYHLAYQGTIAGSTPWYMQSNINTLILRQMMSEGLGAANNFRGAYANRMMADGYAWANTELRVKLVSFKFAGQYFYVGTNPFFDLGAIVQPYRVDEMAKLPEMALKYGTLDKDVIAKNITADATGLQYSYGIGLKIGWNQNFIVNFEIGQTAHDGIGYRKFNWINIGTGYNF